MEIKIKTKHKLLDTVYWIQNGEVQNGTVDNIEITLSKDGDPSTIYCVGLWYLEEDRMFTNEGDALLKLHEGNKENLLKEIEMRREWPKRDQEKLRSLEIRLVKIS